ncbi:MAG TPA: ABATE domain-containing protein [Baekduia sp.]|uniref:CGNR zinc finger domain-containing protein n=1 Tax=Baekduia sp. TaxID=2600305 RepID=UPI002C38ADB3|nr:ABATE domain-containing protein [Baekduia sp.]HMJ34130.1 ABATE domain-containing protein [Baekduia sp.]
MPDRDLPEDLVLPLATGEPWWYWSGGRPAVDFVNTQRERWRRGVETLITPADLSAWLVQAHVMDEPAAVSQAVLAQARDLREAIDALLVATIEDRAAPVAAVTLVDDWLVFAGVRPQLVPDAAGGVPRLTERAAADSPRRALGMIALDAATMLGTEQRSRVRICASETCSGRFFDRSPAGRRRWCSMRTCGNEAKARRHRQRLRKTFH